MNSTLSRLVLPACLVLASCDGPAPDSAAPAPAPATAIAEPAPPVAALKDVEPELAVPELGPMETAFACNGAEPTWSLQVSPDGGWLRLPEGDTAFTGDLRRTDTGAYTWLGIPADDPTQTVALLLAPMHCFPADGSAALPFGAELGLADGRHLRGCCLPSPGD